MTHSIHINTFEMTECTKKPNSHVYVARLAVLLSGVLYLGAAAMHMDLSSALVFFLGVAGGMIGIYNFMKGRINEAETRGTIQGARDTQLNSMSAKLDQLLIQQEKYELSHRHTQERVSGIEKEIQAMWKKIDFMAEQMKNSQKTGSSGGQAAE